MKNKISLILSVSLYLILNTPVYAETVKITLLGIGDVYTFTEKNGRGGLAKINALAKSERAKNKNTLYLFNGDLLSPSLLSSIDKGQHMIDLTNLEPFDLAVPGNHEFDFGVENFLDKVAKSNYPWAAINIKDAKGLSLTQLSGVMYKEFEGVKLSIIPVASDTSPDVSQTGNLQFLSTLSSAIDAAKLSRTQGADIVVGLVQSDIVTDRALIASGAFDVILSGDDHVYGTFYDGRTAYVETSVDGFFLSPLDLTVNISEKNGERLVTWVPNFRFIDTAHIAADPESLKKVEQLASMLDENLKVPIGRTIHAIDTRRNVVRSQESAMGNLIADALVAATSADVAIINGGGIRGDRVYEAGTLLTQRHIISELPFANSAVLVQLSGSDLLAALENGFSNINEGSGRFPQVSGMRISYNPLAPSGERVKSVKINGVDLDLTKVYKVATSDYLLEGNDGFASMSKGQVLMNANNGPSITSVMINYITKNGGVTAHVEGRIQLTPSPP
jgi:5'-nucleotidase / UDP-sugar diphosphatase